MKRLLSGNEAVARGAWEAGVQVASGYPGTPSTEILEEFARLPGVYAEWAPNEKVALDVAIGAAYAGRRAMATMKHVGLNVAADAFFYAAITGLQAGLVVVSADDPGMHSSQNEQDNRNYARFARVPCLEPSDSQEAKDLTIAGLDMSEQLDTPVLLRPTTRICHSSSLVALGERTVRPPTIDRFPRNPAKYVMIPGNARKRHPIVEERRVKLAELAETFAFNRVEMRDRSLGIVTCGVAYQYAREVFPNASILKLGMSYPLPARVVREFARRVDRLIVLEELDPFLEENIRLMGVEVYRGAEPAPTPVPPPGGIQGRTAGATTEGSPLRVDHDAAAGPSVVGTAPPCPPPSAPEPRGRGGMVPQDALAPVPSQTIVRRGDGGNGTRAVTLEAGPPSGKSLFPPCGELDPKVVRDAAIASGLLPESARVPVVSVDPGLLPPRPPILCAGCPHRATYYLLHKLGVPVNGDIGCYSLGVVPPLSTTDTCGCMGASIGVAHGAMKAGSGERHVAVIGDSTFFHTGLPALANVAYNRSPVLTVIMDNRTTGMTGHQENPGTGRTLQQDETYRIELVPLVRALGIQRVATVDAYDVKLIEARLKEFLALDEPSVLITRQACVLLPRARSAWMPLAVKADKCNGCSLCFRLGCPALLKSEALDVRTQRPKAEIDRRLCTGCEVCSQICPRKAISFRMQIA